MLDSSVERALAFGELPQGFGSGVHVLHGQGEAVGGLCHIHAADGLEHTLLEDEILVEFLGGFGVVVAELVGEAVEDGFELH